MKGPWVSRAHLESVEREAAQWKAAYERERDRYEAAMARLLGEKSYAQLPRGTMETDVAVAPRMLTASPDALSLLIDERAGTDLRKRAMMLRQLRADRAANVDDEEIRQRIENGEESSGVPA